MSTNPNTVSPLDSPSRFADLRLVNQPKDYQVDGRTIVVNPAPTPAHVSPRAFIPPFSSTILVDSCIKHAESVLLIQVDDDAKSTEIIEEPGWHLLGNLLTDDATSAEGVSFPKETLLWRGPKYELGSVEFAPAMALGQTPPGGDTQAFRLEVNLWFAPADTDCFIHQEHDFLEVHTQVHGLGRIQKFTAQDRATLYEDVLMSPGRTHQPFCSTDQHGNFVYPWHQYYADTNCIWLALEYHAQ